MFLPQSEVLPSKKEKRLSWNLMPGPKKKELRKRIDQQDIEINRLKNDLAESQKQYQKLMKEYDKVCALWVRTTGDKSSVFLDHLEASCATSWAALGDVESLKTMLSNGASIHKANSSGRTALHEAVYSGHTDCVKFLLESGAEIDVFDRYGIGPLQEAIGTKNVIIATMIESSTLQQEKNNLNCIVVKSESYLDPDQNTFLLPIQPKVETPLTGVHKWVHRERIPVIEFPKNQKKILVPEAPSPNLFKRIKLTGIRSKKLDQEEGSPAIAHAPKAPEFGTAAGIRRGMCLSNSCKDCTFYNDSGKGYICKCGHYPATHKYLGPVKNVLDKAPKLITDQVLIPKNPNQEWPKYLNSDLPPIFVLDIKQDANLITPNEIEFHSEIGKGSAAVVYYGFLQNQEVAIKVVNRTIKDDVQYKDLQQEFDVMLCFMKLNPQSQEYFVKLYGVINNPTLCLVMEYCNKGSLYNLLQKEDFELPWPLLLSWFKTVAHGIKILHNFDPPIVHRDIKTLNLLINNLNQIKIADFGLSRFIKKDNSAMATLTKLRGTYCYSAPEVYFGGSYSNKGDVYSLSIVLWEMVTKCVTGKYLQPYMEYPYINFDFQIIIQVAKNGLRPTIPPQCPPVISELIQALWTEDPNRRMNSLELIETLQSIEQNYEVHKTEWEDLKNGISMSASTTEGSMISSQNLPSPLPSPTISTQNLPTPSPSPSISSQNLPSPSPRPSEEDILGPPEIVKIEVTDANEEKTPTATRRKTDKSKINDTEKKKERSPRLKRDKNRDKK